MRRSLLFVAGIPIAVALACGARSGLPVGGLDAALDSNETTTEDAMPFDALPVDDGPSIDATPPFDAGPPQPMLALGVSSFLLRSDGTLVAWGSNAGGQLGDGTELASTVPKPVSVGAPTRAITSAAHTVCALLVDGRVVCWGDNALRQAGVAGDGVKHVHAPTEMTGVSAKSIALGTAQGCLVRPNGGVACWGVPTPVLGLEPWDDPQANPIPIAGGTDVERVFGTAQRACLITTSRTAKCWGRGEYGQNGDQKLADSSKPVDVVDLTDVTDLAAGLAHTCALRVDGSVWCWGSNVNGECGRAPNDEPLVTPTKVTLPLVATQLDGRQSATCALLADGTAYCWGVLSAGVGSGALTKKFDAPTKVENVPSPIAQIAIGASHVCALTNDGAVWCWGNNLNGALGNGTTTASLVPVKVVGL